MNEQTGRTLDVYHASTGLSDSRMVSVKKEEQKLDIKIILEYATPILTLLLGSFLFYDAKRRKAMAEARKMEADNITSYAAEWKELYEKKEAKVDQLNGKIDELYGKLDEYRCRIRDLKDDKAKLEMENMKLSYHRCDKKGCADRIPPSEVMN